MEESVLLISGTYPTTCHLQRFKFRRKKKKTKQIQLFSNAELISSIVFNLSNSSDY